MRGGEERCERVALGARTVEHGGHDSGGVALATELRTARDRMHRDRGNQLAAEVVAGVVPVRDRGQFTADVGRHGSARVAPLGKVSGRPLDAKAGGFQRFGPRKVGVGGLKSAQLSTWTVHALPVCQT